MAEQLTPKHETFCLEFLKDLNATQAAIRAGYAPANAAGSGSDILKRPEVQKRLAELVAERNKAIKIDANFVLRELLALASVDLAQAYDDKGNLKNIHDIPPDVRKAISGIEALEEYVGTGKNRTFIGYTKKIKFWSREKALEMLGRHIALFNDKLDVNVTVNHAQRLVESRKRAGR